MLSRPLPRRKPSARHPFLAPPWDDLHPDLLRIDASLPADHHARWLADVVAHLDLTSFRSSYAGSGSLAYPVERLLPFVLFLYSKGILSPAEWVRRARYDDQCKWLLRGLRPSRSRLYAFRDRVEPFLDDWHQQLIHWAFVEAITTAAHGSLDGTFVAALASRHQLLSGSRLDRRLLLLRLLVCFDDDSTQADLATRLQKLPAMVLCSGVLGLELLHRGMPALPLLNALLNLLALVELLKQPPTMPWQAHLPAWVPATPVGRKRVLKRHENARKRLAARLLPYQRKKKLSKKDQETMKRMKVSLTDPEAALGYDKVGTYRPLYNLPLVQDTQSSLTLAWEVLSRNNDDGLLKPMMEKTKEQLGRHLKDVRADGAFASVGEVAWCEKEGITVYAPSKGKKAREEEDAVGGKKEEAAGAESAHSEGEKAAGPKAAKPAEENAAA
jgi:transposase